MMLMKVIVKINYYSLNIIVFMVHGHKRSNYDDLIKNRSRMIRNNNHNHDDESSTQYEYLQQHQFMYNPL